MQEYEEIPVWQRAEELLQKIRGKVFWEDEKEFNDVLRSDQLLVYIERLAREDKDGISALDILAKDDTERFNCILQAVNQKSPWWYYKLVVREVVKAGAVKKGESEVKGGSKKAAESGNEIRLRKLREDWMKLIEKTAASKSYQDDEKRVALMRVLFEKVVDPADKQEKYAYEMLPFKKPKKFKKGVFRCRTGSTHPLEYGPGFVEYIATSWFKLKSGQKPSLEQQRMAMALFTQLDSWPFYWLTHDSTDSVPCLSTVALNIALLLESKVSSEDKKGVLKELGEDLSITFNDDDLKKDGKLRKAAQWRIIEGIQEEIKKRKPKDNTQEEEGVLLDSLLLSLIMLEVTAEGLKNWLAVATGKEKEWLRTISYSLYCMGVPLSGKDAALIGYYYSFGPPFTPKGKTIGGAISNMAMCSASMGELRRAMQAMEQFQSFETETQEAFARQFLEISKGLDQQECQEVLSFMLRNKMYHAISILADKEQEAYKVDEHTLPLLPSNVSAEQQRISFRWLTRVGASLWCTLEYEDYRREYWLERAEVEGSRDVVRNIISKSLRNTNSVERDMLARWQKALQSSGRVRPTEEDLKSGMLPSIIECVLVAGLIDVKGVVEIIVSIKDAEQQRGIYSMLSYYFSNEELLSIYKSNFEQAAARNTNFYLAGAVVLFALQVGEGYLLGKRVISARSGIMSSTVLCLSSLYALYSSSESYSLPEWEEYNALGKLLAQFDMENIATVEECTERPGRAICYKEKRYIAQEFVYMPPDGKYDIVHKQWYDQLPKTLLMGCIVACIMSTYVGTLARHTSSVALHTLSEHRAICCLGAVSGVMFWQIANNLGEMYQIQQA